MCELERTSGLQMALAVLYASGHRLISSGWCPTAACHKPGLDIMSHWLPKHIQLDYRILHAFKMDETRSRWGRGIVFFKNVRNRNSRKQRRPGSFTW